MRSKAHVRLSVWLALCFVQACSLGSFPSYASAPDTPNGISVGCPKIFDNRTLLIMLDGLSESLRNVQVVDQKSLSAAFNSTQGFSSSEVASSLSFNTLPIPSIKQEDVTTTGNVSSTGTSLPDTTKSTTTTNRDAFTPQAPALEKIPVFSGFTPNYGESPADLLSDQINLSYQIINLRMLLERSLSDRVTLQGKARMQAVLGFNVTLDPPKTATDAVAVVEITLDTNASRSAEGLSLVSLMPQEKTYNSAALSSKSNAFGGSAVVKVVQVGYSQRQSNQTFYLYRDNDTVSYERMNANNPNQIIFGWMFRPVLGRRSISPGLRQLFAIIALPADDEHNGNQSQLLNARVKTYWKKYDAKTMTSFEERDANRATRFRYGLSLNLSKPEIFAPRYTNEATYNNIEVKSTSKYQESLGPRVSRVSWTATGPKSVVISAEGDNFFTGTQVVIGDKLYSSPADGLILKSNQAFDLKTSLDALASQGAIIGRYGSSITLTSPDVSTAPPGGIRIDGSDLTKSFAGNRLLTLHLKSLGNTDYQGWGNSTPIIAVNGNIVPMPYILSSDGVLRCNVPEAFFSKDGGLVSVSYPFLSNKWTAAQLISDPAADFQITRLGSKSIVILTKSLLGFTVNPENPSPKNPVTDYCWKLILNDQTTTLSTDTCKSADPGSTSLSSNAIAIKATSDIPDKLILIAPNRALFSLDVPKTASSDTVGPKAIMLNQYDAVWIDIVVKDASKVASVEANREALKYRIPPPDKDGTLPKSIQVSITRDLTAKPGDLDLIVLDNNGQKIGDARLHISRQLH